MKSSRSNKVIQYRRKKECLIKNAETATSTEDAIAQVTYDGQQLGVKQGIQKGIQKSKTEMAKAMLKDKLDIPFIAKYTGLTQQELQQLTQTTHI